MAVYRVFLETSAKVLAEGGYLAHVPALLGCIARGKTKEETLAKTREAIDAYLAWNRHHHLDAPEPDEPIELEVIETADPILASDYAALSDDELEDLWHRAALSRQDLLHTLAAMPADALDHKPHEGAWTIRNILTHLAQADLWYASRLDEGGLPELLWRLAATRALVLQRLQNLPAHARARVTQHGDEAWTPRKVARRMLEHEREHLAQLREWLENASRS